MADVQGTDSPVHGTVLFVQRRVSRDPTDRSRFVLFWVVWSLYHSWGLSRGHSRLSFGHLHLSLGHPALVPGTNAIVPGHVPLCPHVSENVPRDQTRPDRTRPDLTRLDLFHCVQQIFVELLQILKRAALEKPLAQNKPMTPVQNTRHSSHTGLCWTNESQGIPGYGSQN